LIGTLSGSEDHFHSFSGTTGQAAGSLFAYASTSGVNFAATGHTHTYSFNSDTLNNLPPYMDLVFIEPSIGDIGRAGVILGSNDLPPLGWINYTDLNDLFPRGSDIYTGISGGSNMHSHHLEFNTDVSNTSVMRVITTPTTSAAGPHYHMVSIDSDAADLPPYFGIPFIKRIDHTYGNKISTVVNPEIEINK
jgi:hypothetical protein